MSGLVRWLLPGKHVEKKEKRDYKTDVRHTIGDSGNNRPTERTPTKYSSSTPHNDPSIGEAHYKRES